MALPHGFRGQFLGGWNLRQFRHSESNGRRHAFIHLLTLYLAIMAFSLGDTPQTESIDQFSVFWESSIGSFANGLHKLEYFAVGLIDLGTIFHQLILGFFFLSLATLQIERLNH